jgi:hypothetical protein
LWTRRWAIPAAIFALCAIVYCSFSGERLLSPSPNNHYVHLAGAWLDGRLDLGPNAPGTNDWACFDRVDRGPCPQGRYSFDGDEGSRYRWYVSFPPLPAVLLTPFVAVWGLATLDRLLWALFAGLAPAFLFIALRYLRESAKTAREPRDDFLLTALFAVGSVYFFVAVQGEVWFAAQVVASAFVCLYLFFSFDARFPALSGLMLGLAFASRPATVLLFPFFTIEAVRAARSHPSRSPSRPRLGVLLGRFAAPLSVIVLVVMWYNFARFHDPLEFGHRFLQIRWRPRIETWGLFDIHYLRRNLTVYLASLPWLYASSPFVRISRHGLALWFTTPNLLWSLFPKSVDATTAALWAAVVPTALCTLLYQNTGWVQFGYRFSLDYLPLVFALMALTGRRFGKAFLVCAVFSIVVNTFGAVTFNRHPQFYDTDPTQEVIFKQD